MQLPGLSAIPVALVVPCQKPEAPSTLPTREVTVWPASPSLSKAGERVPFSCQAQGSEK